MASPRSSSRTNVIPLVIGGLLVLALALGVALLGGGDEPGPTAAPFDLSAVSAPTIEGESLAPDATGVEAPYVRADALLSEGQNEFPVEGEGTMVVFLAHWCPACNAELPVVNRWLEESGLPEGTELRAVATAIDQSRPNFPPDEWLRDNDWTVPTVVDADGSIAEAYGVDSFPHWTFVDGDGIVQGVAGAQPVDVLVQVAESLATE